MKNANYFIIGILLLLTACSAYNQTDFEEEYMVESYLITDRNLPQVRLSTTQEAFDFYSFDEAAVSDASIQIHLLGNDGSREQTFNYSNTEPGIYIANNSSYIIEAGRTYELQVETASTTLSAFTTIPPAILSNEPNQEPLIYQGEEQFAIDVPSTSTDDRQTTFIFAVLAEDNQEENLTPFYASVFEETVENDNDFDQNEDSVKTVVLSELAIVNSGIVNEANYEIQPNGNIRIRLPWIAVAFYGKNVIVANSIDDNLLDFYRSQSVQLGGSTLAPGEIQNIISHIEGGIGVFGSISTDTAIVDILPNPLFDID